LPAAAARDLHSRIPRNITAGRPRWRGSDGDRRARRRQYGIDVAQIYRAANNKLVDRMIARFRRTGSEFIPKGAVASRRALAALRRGAHLTLLVARSSMMDPGPVLRPPGDDRPGLGAPGIAFRLPVLPARVERLRARISG